MFIPTGHRDAETSRDGSSTSRSRCLSASVTCVAVVILWLSPVAAQQLLDRIVARVNGVAITLTDVKAAIALGIADAPEASAVQQLIDRQLVLGEVARFLPPEPPASAVALEAGALTTRAGVQLPEIVASTGVDEARIRELARENLRIQSYLNQRFGVNVLTEEEVARYYRIHPEEFTRGGTLMPFAEAEPLARERASAERRASTVTQWMRDLRSRAAISLPQ
jgi:hypothetical protein